MSGVLEEEDPVIQKTESMNTSTSYSNGTCEDMAGYVYESEEKYYETYDLTEFFYHPNQHEYCLLQK